jgi:CHAT domain-containing protein
VHLAATGEGGLALILRDGSVEAVELPELTAGDAAMLAEALDEAVETPDRILADEICEALWGMAMSRVMPALDGAAHAIVVPGGRLATLPWHAARIPGQPAEYVLDRLALSYLPNIRSAARARAAGQDMTPPLRALAIEQPEPTATRPLPSADAEIAAVHSHGGEQFRVTWLPGTEATADAVREALSWFQVIHFAGHAVAVPEDPLASAMIMAHDQRLTVRDIMASGIGAARFAVLSACETARAENPLSDEIISFPTALLQCGLTGVVGTLWAASDRAAAMVMEAFYQEWQGHGAHPAQALRRAQQQVRGGRFASPLFWAPFVYVGP